MTRTKQALVWTALAALYTALTLMALRPIWRVGGDHLTNSLGDPLFNLYVLKWGVHQIRLGLPDVWNANLFHPTRGALALSDHLLGPAAQLALFLLAVPNAVAGYNVLLFTSFVGSALATCWVFRRAGLSWAAAVLGGWMFAFAPFRFSQAAHLQLLLAQWIPLTLWFWDRLLAERTARNAALFLAFYLLHVTGGCYLAYMIHVPLACLLASRVISAGAERTALVSRRSLAVLAPVALVAAVAVAALFLPYVRLAREQGFVRTESEAREFGATFASYFSPAPQNVYFGPPTKARMRALLGPERARRFFRPENALFAGFLPTVLFEVGAVAAWRRRREGPPDPWTRGLAASGIVCFALSFAAVYAPLMRIVPGLSGMRVPSRWYLLVSFSLVWFAARGADALLARMPGPRARAALAAAMALVLFVELTPRPLYWAPVPREEEIPDVYRRIGRDPSVQALIELPIREDSRENLYLYNATVHWKPIANGFSGYWPPSHAALTERIAYLPDEGGLDLLRSYRITHVVVHAGGKREKLLREWEARFAAGPGRQVEKVDGEGTISVYRLLPPPGPASSSVPNRPGLWKSGGEARVGDQALNSGSPPRGRSMR